MAPHATLKAYEPLEAFGEEESAYWKGYVETAPPSAGPPAVLLSRDRGVKGTIAVLAKRHALDAEQADVLLLDRPYVCPHRTRLRLLASVVTFRRLIPAEAMEAFMPEGEAERALRELEKLRAQHPDWKTNVLSSTWEVRPHWFVAFGDEEREQSDGTIRYRTEISAALARTSQAVVVLRRTMPGSGVVELVSEFGRWLGQFHPEAKLVLDYGNLGRLFSENRLDEDHSAGDIQAAILALSQGDLEEAAEHYAVVGERWATIRSLEGSN